MTNEKGGVVWEASYKPFGEVDVGTNSTVVNNFRFPGQYLDEETGLHYNYHRYYISLAGRFINADPIGLLGGINVYAYVLNNPINSVDLFGLDSCKLEYDDSLLESFSNFLLKYGVAAVSFNFGNGVVGLSGQMSITANGIQGYVGAGWGVGFGIAGTAGLKAGDLLGWTIQGSLSGGASVGANLNVGISQGDNAQVGGGLGFGAGIGATATVGYSGTIINF
jgi:RHS repeat-associated protein